MDSKTFISHLSKSLGTDTASTGKMVDALAKVVAEIGAELDSVAIPGFGTFQTVKTDEHVEVDPATQQRTLVPPAITMHFQPSVVMRKKMMK